MRTLDPGHIYWLEVLDVQADRQHGTELLTFVKRQGARYPGNLSHYPGTTCQEVIRALIDRVSYLDGQVPDPRNRPIIQHLREALWLFESRAAEKYGRVLPSLQEFDAIEQERTCPNCSHIRCRGDCGRRETETVAKLSTL